MHLDGATSRGSSPSILMEGSDDRCVRMLQCESQEITTSHFVLLVMTDNKEGYAAGAWGAGLPEAPLDVIGGLFHLWIEKELFPYSVFDQLPLQEERGEIGGARGLLLVVRYEQKGVIVLSDLQELLDLMGGHRV